MSEPRVIKIIGAGVRMAAFAELIAAKTGHSVVLVGPEKDIDSKICGLEASCVIVDEIDAIKEMHRKITQGPLIAHRYEYPSGKRRKAQWKEERRKFR